MRAAGQLDLPGLTGAWAWAAFVILLVDSQNISLEKLKSWRVGAVAALAIVPATLIDFGREALFRWTDLVLAPVSGASGPTNWFLTVTLAALANAVGRMLVELGPPEEGAGETVRRAFFRALPFAVLLAIAVKSQVSRL